MLMLLKPMMVVCISGLILVLFGAKSVSGCYKKEHIFVNDTRELVPTDHPSRMLGWEQMVLMFGDQNGWANVQREDVNATTKAWGVTERGTVCHFEMRLGMTFEKGSAGIIPTHGGFLMCGRLLASSDPTLKKGVFTCCYWANKRYAILNHTCHHIPSFFDKLPKKSWAGVVLGTDNVLEQYQNTLYAFFQETGEVYIGGIIWSVGKDEKDVTANRWIINWVKISNKKTNGCKVRHFQSNGKDNGAYWPCIDPCMAVIGTDMFLIGGKNKNSRRLNTTYGYRLNAKEKTGTWFKVKDYLTTPRSNAACVVDKLTKDIFTIGGQEEGRPTVEIGRYQANSETIAGRLIGYHISDEKCPDKKNCDHFTLEELDVSNVRSLVAVQLDNNDGNKYKTVVLGRDLMDEAVVNSTQPSGNDSSRADDLQFEPGELAYLRASRIHMDKEAVFKMTKNSPAFNKKLKGSGINGKIGFDDFGKRSFHAVVIKSIGFHPCRQVVPFKKNGKLVVEDPDPLADGAKDADYYRGYWWDEENQHQVDYPPDDITDKFEYYYYLNPNYLDN